MKIVCRLEPEYYRGYPKSRFGVGLMCDRRLDLKTMTETLIGGWGVYVRLFGRALALFYVTRTATNNIHYLEDLA